MENNPIRESPVINNRVQPENVNHQHQEERIPEANNLPEDIGDNNVINLESQHPLVDISFDASIMEKSQTEGGIHGTDMNANSENTDPLLRGRCDSTRSTISYSSSLESNNNSPGHSNNHSSSSTNSSVSLAMRSVNLEEHTFEQQRSHLGGSTCMPTERFQDQELFYQSREKDDENLLEFHRNDFSKEKNEVQRTLSHKDM